MSASSSAPATTATAASAQGGFALLVLLGLVGVGSVGILLAVQSLVAPLAEVPARAERNMAVAEHAARFAFRSNGAFPTNLNGLAQAARLDPTADWRIDPWSPPLDLDYRRPTTGANVRSRGRDGRLNTSDDMQVLVPAESLVRVRQRGRLRLVRAVLVRSPFNFTATMGTDHATLRAALRDHAIARRAWLTADAATRVTLQATLTATAASVASLRSLHGCSPLPNRMVGTGGLMEQLGMPDSRCYDGFGRRLVRDSVLGVGANGYDRRRGTDDDM